MHSANNALSDDDEDREPSTRRNAPTVPPPPIASVIRYKSGAPVDELLYRMAMGDAAGAVDAAQALFDARYVPVLILPPLGLGESTLGYREELLLSLVAGQATLTDVIDGSGLEMIDALRALCELIEKDVIAVC
jgi:hypothetical protein